MPIESISKFDLIVDEIKKAKFIWIIGNGGLAAQADHFACDLLKNAKLKAISLCSNNSLISAISNDYNFNICFSKQLEVLFDFGKDILICLSTSGESGNLIMAAQYVYTHGGKVISITGKFANDGGGYIQNFTTHSLILDVKDQQKCEDGIAQICHEIYRALIKQ